MNDFHAAIRRFVTEALGLPADTDVTIGAPPSPEMGDYAVPMFPFAKALRAAPPALAQKVAAAFVAAPGGAIASVTAAGPYVNVRVDRASFLGSLLGRVEREADAWGRNAGGAGRT